MNYKTFNQLVGEAIEYETFDMFLSVRGWQEWMNEYENDNQIVEDLKNIYEITNLTFKELIKRTGLTQKQFGDRFNIPLRTIENWVGGQRECPIYIKIMICDLLGYISVNRS